MSVGTTQSTDQSQKKCHSSQSIGGAEKEVIESDSEQSGDDNTVEAVSYWTVVNGKRRSPSKGNDAILNWIIKL